LFLQGEHGLVLVGVLATPQHSVNTFCIATAWRFELTIAVWFRFAKLNLHSLPSAPDSPNSLQPHTPTLKVLFVVIDPAFYGSALEIYKISSLPALL
jgi:hypothetical protein